MIIEHQRVENINIYHQLYVAKTSGDERLAWMEVTLEAGITHTERERERWGGKRKREKNINRKTHETKSSDA